MANTEQMHVYLKVGITTSAGLVGQISTTDAKGGPNNAAR